MNITSKLPSVGTTIFTVMSRLANEHKAINLSQGFPNFDCDQALKDRISFHLNNGKNQYVPMAGLPQLRKQLAQKTERSHGVSINPETEITVTAGATQALFTAIMALIHPGEEVIIIEPAYDCYRPAIGLAGGITKAYVLEGPDYKIDWELLEKMVTDKTKMIIVNTPHNPIGKTLKRADMEQLEKIAVQHDLLVISDEVYEHIIFDGEVHQSALRFPALFQRTLAVYSFGKTFHSTGWKVGYIIAPEYLMKEFRKVHQFNVFSVNSFVQYALADYLAEPNHYQSLPDFYQVKRDFFQAAMKGSKFKALPSEGSYFQLYDYSAISDLTDTEFAKKMTIDHGVAAIPVSAFYDRPIHFPVIRLCFAKTEEVLSAAAKKLNAIESIA